MPTFTTMQALIGAGIVAFIGAVSALLGIVIKGFFDRGDKAADRASTDMRDLIAGLRSDLTDLRGEVKERGEKIEDVQRTNFDLQTAFSQLTAKFDRVEYVHATALDKIQEMHAREIVAMDSRHQLALEALIVTLRGETAGAVDAARAEEEREHLVAYREVEKIHAAELALNVTEIASLRGRLEGRAGAGIPLSSDTVAVTGTVTTLTETPKKED